MDVKRQRYHVVVEFDYEAEVFEDDPNDVFELAQLEARAVEQIMRVTAASLDPYASFNVRSVSPID